MLWAVASVMAPTAVAMSRAVMAQTSGGAVAPPASPTGNQGGSGPAAAGPAAPNPESGMTPPGQTGGGPAPAGPGAPNLESGMTPPGQAGGGPAPVGPGAPNLESGMTPPGQAGGGPAPAGPAAPNLESGMTPPGQAGGGPPPAGPVGPLPPALTRGRAAPRPTSAAHVPSPAGGALAPEQRSPPSAQPVGTPASSPIRGPAVPTLGGGTVSDIRVVGTQRIEPETVRSYLQLQPGDPWDDEKVNASLKALFATGLFADVRLSRVGNTLVVKVVENPIINRIAFEGNHKLDDKDLNAEIQLRPRVVYTRTRVQNDVKRILDLYRRHGRFGATVEPKIIQLSENRVDLVFEINEGEFTGVRSINFVGNKAVQRGQAAWRNRNQGEPLVPVFIDR